MIGGLLITGGVVGEVFNEVHASKVETSLRAANNAVIVGLNGTIVDLRERALVVSTASADRRISLDAQRQIAARLSKFAGYPVEIRAYPNDEAITFAQDIQATLQAARLQVWSDDSHLPNDVLGGIRVLCANNDRAFAGELASVLTRLGRVDVEPISQFGCSENVAEIVIGPHPALRLKRK